MKRADVFEFYRRLAEANPSPETELEYVNPYTLLVAVALSAQSTDVGVNKATRACSPRSPRRSRCSTSARRRCASTSRPSACSTPRRRTSSPRRRCWSTDHGGEVPRDRAALETLPGVGRKTANVVLNAAFGEPTHRGRHAHLPRRQPHRPGAAARTPLEVELKLEKVTPEPFLAARPPLADPARPLHLQGAHARMLALPGDRPVRLQAEDAARRRLRTSAARTAG